VGAGLHLIALTQDTTRDRVVAFRRVPGATPHPEAGRRPRAVAGRSAEVGAPGCQRRFLGPVPHERLLARGGG
jgi:hypothetical protein